MTVAEKETVSGNLRSAGINTVMGVGTVFVVLLFLVFVISLFKYVGKIGSGEEKKETEKKTPAAPAQPAAPHRLLPLLLYRRQTWMMWKWPLCLPQLSQHMKTETPQTVMWCVPSEK